MPLTIDWSEIALRLLLSAVASAAIGVNHGETERPVGLRTTMLVSLTATISMIQVNLLLPVAGKAADSFVVMDLMRLPLGILSGMGFIGRCDRPPRKPGSRRHHRRDLVVCHRHGPLCFGGFGGGQNGLGIAAMTLAILVLWPLKWVEHKVGLWRRGELSITIDGDKPVEDAILLRYHDAGYTIADCAIAIEEHGKRRTVRCRIRWHERHPSQSPTELAHEAGRQPGVTALNWRPLDQ
jgi:putative Mg2+ transporter-C (MgtC) family protein